MGFVRLLISAVKPLAPGRKMQTCSIKNRLVEFL
jgi:hypothetical protein